MLARRTARGNMSVWSSPHFRIRSPRFDDPEVQRVASVVQGIAGWLILVGLCWLPIGLLLPSWPVVWATALPGIAALAAVLWLNRSGRVREASLLLVADLFVCSTVVSLLGSDVSAGLMGAALLTVVTAGLVFRPRGAALTALLASGAIAAGLAVRPLGLGHDLAAGHAAGKWAQATLMIAAAAVLVGAAASRSRRAFLETHGNEQALIASEARYRTLVESAQDMVAEIDDHGRYRYASPNHEEALGWRPEELVGRDLSDLIHPDDARLSGASFGSRFPLNSTIELTARIRHRDGSWRWLEARGGRFVTATGEERVVTIGRDVTERLAADRALRESEARLHAAFENVPCDFWVCDPDGRFVFQNSMSIKHWGDRTGEPFDALDLPPEQIEVWSDCARRARAGEVVEGETEISLGGEHRVIHYIFAPIRDGDEVRGILGVDIDLTERRSLELQLRQSQKMEAVGRLAGGIAHDFNNLLTAITGFGEMLLAQLPPDGSTREAAEQIYDAANRAGALTRQLLAFSRGQLLRPEVIDPNDVTRSLEPLLRRLIEEHVAIELDLDGTAPRVEADRSQLEQVIVNLAVNARDAMADGGRLVLSTRLVSFADQGPDDLPPGSYLRLRMRDDGQGMDGETLTRIFEPFFTTKEEGRGTGLGLSTAYGIVRQSGGTISATSREGQGSTFDVFLPAVEASPAASPGAFAQPGAPLDHERTVLVVEDDGTVRELIRRALRAAGWRVLEAASGEEGLECAAAEPGPIHVLATDVVMPGMRGVELARRLRESRPETRVLFISGYADAPPGAGALPADARILAKPFRPSDLDRSLRELLD